MLFIDLSPAQIASFQKDGYVIIKNFCNRQELERLHTIAIAANIFI